MHEIVQMMFNDENPKSIFEVGCAQGKLFKDYYDQCTRLDNTKDTEFDCTRLVVGGLDNDARNIPGAKEIYPEYADNFFIADATLPFPMKANSYDIVFTIGTLLIIKDPYPVIKEMLRVCKDKIIIAEFQDDNATDMGIADETGNIYTYRIYRDYRKVFKKLGKKIEIIGQASGKTIIKCNKV